MLTNPFLLQYLLHAGFQKRRAWYDIQSMQVARVPVSRPDIFACFPQPVHGSNTKL